MNNKNMKANSFNTIILNTNMNNYTLTMHLNAFKYIMNIYFPIHFNE